MLGHFKSELDETIKKVEGLLLDPDFATCVGDYSHAVLNAANFLLRFVLNSVDAKLMSYEDSL